MRLFIDICLTQLGMTFTYLPLKFFTPEVNIFSSILVNIFTTEVNFQDLPPGFKIKNLWGQKQKYSKNAQKLEIIV